MSPKPIKAARRPQPRTQPRTRTRTPAPTPAPARKHPALDPVARGDLDADSVAATSVVDLVKYDERGLVPVIAQEEDGTVLMLAWANREALELTLATGRGTYWSRSRQALWRKGDTSGHQQLVSRVAVDCDGDSVLYVLRQTGPACHTGAKSCFFTSQEIPWPTSASSPRSGRPSRPAATTRRTRGATPASSSRPRPRPARR